MKSKKDIFSEIEVMVLKDAAKIFSPIVIEHFNNPRNMGALEKPDGYTFMSGMCGDTVGIFVKIAGGKICQIGFVTDGCGPTIACASAATTMAKGKIPKDVRKITSKQLIEFLGGTSYGKHTLRGFSC